MIYVYTSEPRDVTDYVKMNDAFFNVVTAGKTLSKLSKDLIFNIDHATLNEHNRIETKYGLGSLTNLSTGCKTAINVVENPDKLFCAFECGDNALNEIFKLPTAKIVLDRGCLLDIPITVEICVDDCIVLHGSKEFSDWWSRR